MPPHPTTACASAPDGLPSPPSAVLSVSALNRLARESLEAALPLLWVGGEISNLVRAGSGHLYFTLKDANAQVRCAMWRSRAQLIAFRPENGMRVEARALVTLYEPRGDYQLNVETLRPAGIGNLFEAFNQLKAKLAAEGLFDPAGRRPLPRFPRAVGVITSPQAAALRDVLVTLARRAPHLPVVLYPVPVQGAEAGARIADTVGDAGRRAVRDGIDLLLVVRGGGSLEDLWAFNDERLARALRACPIPVVSGIGHETDFTIADFAADLRAPTPTGAAELASAGWHAARAELAALQPRLERALERRIEGLAQRVDRAGLRLLHPRERLRREGEAIARLGERLHSALGRRLEDDARRLAHARLTLSAHAPRPGAMSRAVDALGHRLQFAVASGLERRKAQLSALAAHLEHLAPQAVLRRGYAIARDAHGQVLRSAQGIPPGAVVSVELADGKLDTRVVGHLPD